MQKLFFALTFAALLLCGCDDYDDSALRGDLNDLENRVAKLEQLCNQMNTNIASLQSILSAMQSYDYITGVTPIMQEGKEVGYTILFSKSSPITIYHGQKGTDGSTPDIGVKQDTDGRYYWTLNGAWFTDDDGQKIIAEGVKGEPGEAGAAGTTPTFQIVDNYWQVSYDGGHSWTQLGKATGESSDSVFSDIDFQSDPNYVLFTLADGTQIKLPTWSAFEALQTLCNQTNTNLKALQAIVEAIEQNDYITSVDPLTENGSIIGYTIKFAKSNPIVIYNGKDGVSGTTPEIGVKQDADGNYYWTLNGEFIEVDGQKIRAQGKDGANGSDGTNGTTPKLKIEEGYWWISYNNGGDWDKLDKATGEDGKDGDGITITQDEDNVYFHLPDGTTITISKSGNYVDPRYIHFEDPVIGKICITRWDTNNDYKLSYEEAAAITNLGTAFQGNAEIEFFDELKYFTGLTSLAANVFKDCSNLLKLTIPANISEIDATAFTNCKQLTRVIFEKGSQLKKIAGCEAKATKQIGTFAETAIITIEIPANVEVIEPYAFGRCGQLERVIFEADSHLTKIDGGQVYTSSGTLYNGAFSRCSSLTAITLPASLESIEMCAFKGCADLQSVAFEVGSKLKKIAGYSNIANGEYYGAFSGLRNLIIFDASNCTQIEQFEDSAFYNCSNLRDVRIGTINPPKAIGNSASTYPFSGINANAILYVPEESIESYKNTYAWTKCFQTILPLEE